MVGAQALRGHAESSTALVTQREARASSRDTNRTERGMDERTPFGSVVPTTLFVTTANNRTDSVDTLTCRYSSSVSFFFRYPKLTFRFKPILFSLAIRATSRLPKYVGKSCDLFM